MTDQLNFPDINNDAGHNLFSSKEPSVNHKSLNSDHLVIRLEHMEALILENLNTLGKSIENLSRTASPQPAMEPSARETGATGNWQALSARLSLLEEGFGRICNTLGRLDQEFQLLKQSIGKGEE